MMYAIICNSWMLEIADWADVATIGTSHLVSVTPCIIVQFSKWANGEVEVVDNDKIP